MAARVRLALSLMILVGLAACSSSSASRSSSPSPQASATPSGSPTTSATNGPANAQGPTAPPQSSVCRDPGEHVYHPDRLQVRTPCLTVTGVVTSVIAEPDGDYHIRLRLDSQFASLINSANVSGQHGDLLLEPVCEHPVVQPDAIATCQGVAPSVPLPATGIHAVATGAYVLDTTHGWLELHPLWDIHQG